MPLRQAGLADVFPNDNSGGGVCGISIWIMRGNTRILQGNRVLVTVLLL
jgi:hypothetical protein